MNKFDKPAKFFPYKEPAAGVLSGGSCGIFVCLHLENSRGMRVYCYRGTVMPAHARRHREVSTFNRRRERGHLSIKLFPLPMAHTEKNVDMYIAHAGEFARPILEQLRHVVHQACPEVQETIKWGCPHFLYSGKILCSMASFKTHCAFAFRLGSLMDDPDGIMKTKSDEKAMGHLGQIRKLSDLPSRKILIRYIRQAMTLTDEGARVARAKRSSTAQVEVPADFLKLLKKDKAAFANFEKSSYSHRKEYVQWITEARTEETRNRRMVTAVEWLREGKARNWKYM